ncbi:LacI family DNA-binding transcriptional regulator [Nakamurella flavida]|uniref:LacI family DNA-binding transcriptional regulator n=1 Tax=Nakamurella flavida TaxID=363630 RepID=A0A938YP43_9ACTN|nr:LacI family DNA-binding transcriptional regulator [Nakamurella flavida]
MDEERGRPAKRPTIADVAALAGVSRAAVSKVFNDSGRISEPTALRIRDAAAKLHWTPSSTAVALRKTRTQTVGLVLNRPGELEVGATSSLLISGVESVLTPRGYGLLMYLVDRGLDEEARTYQRLSDNRRVDGVILTDSRVGDNRFSLTRSLGLPAVLIGTPWENDVIPHVDSDPPGAGVDDSVRHLVELGHRRIAYVGGPVDRVQAVLRRITFEESMSAAGLVPTATVATDYSPASAAAHTAALLRREVRPTGILYGSDTMAIGGMQAAREAGYSVPQDLSIVGFDGLPLGVWVDPALTTVQRDAVQRGRIVAMRMLDLLGESLEEPPLLSRPYLVVRGSTAAAPE